jgi:DNA topoisomerase-1
LKPLVDERKGTIRRPIFQVDENISVQFGRNGFFLVEGDLETGRTATVPEDIAPADLTTEIATSLFEKKAAGPESIGIDPVTGRRLLVKNRSGYYLEAERTKEEIEAKQKPRWISVPPGVNPADLAPEELNALCYLPRSIGTDGGEEVWLKMGKYGGYVEKGVERRTIENWRQLLVLTMDEALAALAEPKTQGRVSASSKPESMKEFGMLVGAEGPVKLMAGRYGPYVTDGKTNATLPKTTLPEDLTAQQAAELLKAKREAGPAPKRRFVKRRK